MVMFYSTLILLVIGLIFGVTVVYLDKLIKNVKIDDRESKIKEDLAGYNCGACGYPSCDAFAKALLNKETDLTKCRITKQENKDSILKILGEKNDSKTS